LDTLKHSLSQFEAITLQEMENVKLMERTDTKYTFHVSQLLAVLQESVPFYKVRIIENTVINRYKTMYYDTEGFDLYNSHHSGKLNRYKIRHRTYVESNLGFLEVKFKNNKGTTFKTRIREEESAGLKAGKAYDFLKKQLPFDPATLVPKILINYSRITLVNKISAERLTIDLNLEFKKNDVAKTVSQIVIAEVKQAGKAGSPFASIMKQKHIREGAISKYCFAVASSYTEVKKNNFKQKLAYITKLINAS